MSGGELYFAGVPGKNSFNTQQLLISGKLQHQNYLKLAVGTVND